MSSEVKRYDAVHIRYGENNIRYGEGCEVEVVTAADYEREVMIAIAAGIRMQDKCAALEAECERLRAQVSALQSDANSWQSGYDKGREDGAKAAEGWKAQHARDSAELRRLCAERDQQWRIRRDAEADRDTANAVSSELRAQRDALRAELEAIKGQEPVAFYWQDIGYPEPRTHGPFFGWPSEAALRNVDGGAIPVPLYTLPPAIRSPGVQASGPYASVADGLAKRYPKPSLLKDCNVSYSNSSRPLDEQGERQEAVAWIVPDFGFLFPTEDAAQRYLRNINDLRKPTALYATPQPGPDVRALVEALRSAHSAIVYRGDAVSYDDALRRIDAALAAHRQEQPQ